MKSNRVRKAYQNIRPDEAARSRMLNSILRSSEIPPMGKDEQKMRRKTKPMVIAALIVLMIMLMGCAVLALSLQELKIGETSYRGRVLDSEGNLVKESEWSNDVISLHGLCGSPTYLAHQEWYQFKEEYDARHTITEAENVFVPPEAYEAYSVYNQELIDKVDEIAEKYDLKLLGTFAPFQKSERMVFYEALGIESLLNSGSTAVVEKESGYFYEGGNFKVDFSMTMIGEEDRWPYRMINSMYYSKADYFDTVHFVISNSEDWKQWNYTTSTGAEVLIACAKSGYGARIFHSREDALISIGVDGYYQNDDGAVTFITERQLEQIADQFDYSIKVENVDMELAKEQLERFAKMPDSEQITADWQNYADYGALVQGRLAADAEELFYRHIDLQDDGTQELILGTSDQIDSVWTIIDGSVKLIMDYGENYQKLEEAWPDMERKPITEYFVESANKDKYGYQEYINELLSMEHPENSLYVLQDINSDHILDLLIGDQEQLSFVWSIKYDENGNSSIRLLSYSMTEQEWNAVKAAWPEMDRKPVTEYFSE